MANRSRRPVVGHYLVYLIALALLVNAAAFQGSRTARFAEDRWRTLPRMSEDPPTHVRMSEDVDQATSNIKSEEDLRKVLVAATEGPTAVGETVTTEDFIDLDGDFIASLKVRRPYLSILTERLMQTVDDYQLSQLMKKSFPTASTRLSVAEVQTKERIVVLGTGWGGHAFLKTIDATKYDVTIISPRNYFTFTPMLAASAVGTVEFRSICEPIRNVNPLANYLEAAANSIDLEKKSISCLSIKCQGTACDVADFEVPYDYLVLAVGATVNTFGIKGVKEHCQFLKQVEDAATLRKAIANCFERANIPGLSEEEIRGALSFVIVGAGPTGVEFTSELRDWLEVEGRRYYGKLLKYVKITLVEAGDAVLAVFDEALQREAMQRLTARQTSLVSDGFIVKEATRVMLKSGVKEVSETYIEFSNGDRLTYGFCVWAAGNGPIPLVLSTVEKVPYQKEIQDKARGRVAIDGWLRVVGTEGVYSLGDCSFMVDTPLPATAQVASQQGSYLGRLFSKGFSMRGSEGPPIKMAPGVNVENVESVESSSSTSAGAGAGADVDTSESVEQQILRAAKQRTSPSPSYSSTSTSTSTSSSTSTSAAVRFASDQANIGKLGVARPYTSDTGTGAVVVEYAKPFQFLNLGVLAYIGASEALAQISVDQKTIRGTGSVGFLLWRGIYWFKQVSWRNRVLVSVDWAKGRLFGRDIGSL